jgi:hypothetical protein
MADIVKFPSAAKPDALVVKVMRGDDVLVEFSGGENMLCPYEPDEFDAALQLLRDAVVAVDGTLMPVANDA